MYAADSGLISAVLDSAKKFVGRGCALCAITHGLMRKRPEFAMLECSVGVPIELVHRDEREQFGIDLSLPLPCILADVSGSDQSIVVMNASAIERLRGTVQDLRGRLMFRTAALGLDLPLVKDSG